METWYKYSCRGFIWLNLDFITDNFKSSVLELPHSFEKLQPLLQLKNDLIFILFILRITNQKYSNFIYTVICIRTRLNVILLETRINTFGCPTVFLHLKMQLRYITLYFYFVVIK